MTDLELQRLQEITEEQNRLSHELKELLDRAWHLSNLQEDLRLEGIRLVGKGHIDIEFELDEAGKARVVKARRQRDKSAERDITHASNSSV